MQSLTQTSPTRKYTRKLCHAILLEVHGVALRNEDGDCFFYGHDGSIVQLGDGHGAALTLLGEVHSTAAQVHADEARGGAARIACHRAQGRS